jgi:hypothetical protein
VQRQQVAHLRRLRHVQLDEVGQRPPPVPRGAVPVTEVAPGAAELPQAPGVVSSLSFSGDNTLLAVGEEAYGNNVEVAPSRVRPG